MGTTMLRSAAVAIALLVGATPALAAAPIRTETVAFDKGASSKTVNGQVRGYDSVDYLVSARAGQTLKVAMKTASPSAYFNVLPPQGEEALFVGSIAGASYSGKLTTAGAYRVRVYLMRNAARRGQTARFSLDIGVTG
ncbi:MAG: hypothetical protein BGN86_05570 [Caulobacterales bacterium 68-7]|nr:MAG: hypothetical protein BGN86_05570 [Caulobacterales bacterium 68-7]